MTWKVLNLGWVVTKKTKKTKQKNPQTKPKQRTTKNPLDNLPMKFIEFP